MDWREEFENKQLLIVDDDQDTCEVLAEFLRARGYAVQTASSVKEALTVIRDTPIRLVLSDIHMPGEDGLSLLTKIKAQEPELDVVMVTGLVDADTAIKAIREGASDYVTKPFRLEEVQIIIDRNLEKRRLILENRAHQEHLEEVVKQRTEEVVRQKGQLEELYQELQTSYESCLQATVAALELRDNETQGHSFRVVEYAVLLAERLGIGEPDLTWIRRGAILHDVGKIGIADAILLKPDKLTPAERVEMEKHPEMGFRMLQHIEFLRPALELVLAHQEHFDGTGYPRGLHGEAIPLGARIFAVVDAFDAITSDRPYRSARSISQARMEIAQGSGTQFDPQVVRAFETINDEVWVNLREQALRHLEETRQYNGSQKKLPH